MAQRIAFQIRKGSSGFMFKLDGLQFDPPALYGTDGNPNVPKRFISVSDCSIRTQWQPENIAPTQGTGFDGERIQWRTHYLPESLPLVLRKAGLRL